ncbi:MAG TPA: ABC transporter substrate-binding protein [Bacillota bacterium]|jgi:multiple sugar transport system substrate-binding protein|nr:ABC transporter substrate-binding protein [Bacillota bacterium]HOB43422.1 ABC transporter substrate-binding protein [Bacillota bacterium]HOK70168.1 ABC transporter substrate-binding protein [Bacillota bacterium]HOL50945.1 ABC transporter substrate-binding protein [Bacillota bacterium]HOO30985.1 ABC transporter substrate-binding protein [Bacillota bacterium]
MKRVVTAIVVGLVLAAMIVPVSAAKKVTINFWQAGGDSQTAPVMRQIIKEFEAANPDISVNFQAVPWGEDPHVKFQAAIVGGTIADVFTIGDPFQHVLAASGALEPLDKYMSKEMKRDFYPQFLERCSVDGKVVALPWFGDVRAMLYRKDLFKAAGVPEPNPSWTWDEFLTYAKKLTRDTDGDGVIDQYGFGTSGRYVSQYQVFLVQNGVNFIDEEKGIATANTPAAIEAMQFYVDLVRKHKVTPPGITTIALQDIQKMFAEGKVAMFFDASDTAVRFSKEPALAGKLGVALLPHNKAHGAFGGSDVIVMSSQSRNKAAAWKFLSFMVSREPMLAYCKACGFSPVLKSASTDPYVKADPIRKVYTEQMEIGGFFYFKHPKASSMTPVIRAEVQQAMEGTKSVQAAMNDMQKALEDLLKSK